VAKLAAGQLMLLLTQPVREAGKNGPHCLLCSKEILLQTTRGVSHCQVAIYIKKYLKAKEELWTLKYFTMQK
jgi:hypothetical protein